MGRQKDRASVSKGVPWETKLMTRSALTGLQSPEFDLQGRERLRLGTQMLRIICETWLASFTIRVSPDASFKIIMNRFALWISIGELLITRLLGGGR
jgi:hypothetical protein